MFKKLKTQIVYQDAWVTIYCDQVQFQDGKIGTYTWVSRKNGVGIVAINKRKHVLLQHEYRDVIGKYSWEIPGGGQDEGETIEAAARRELIEESGLTPVGPLIRLSTIYPLNSFNTEQITYFLAQVGNQKPTDIGSETSEHFGEHRFFSFSEAIGMIDRGEINDGPTCHVIQQAARYLGIIVG